MFQMMFRDKETISLNQKAREREREREKTLMSGFIIFKKLPVPVTVPPVPIPATNISTLPNVSSQISGPVVSKWILPKTKTKTFD